MIDMRMKQLLYYSGNYTTYQKTRGDAEVNQVSAISLYDSISPSRYTVGVVLMGIDDCIQEAAG